MQPHEELILARGESPYGVLLEHFFIQGFAHTLPLCCTYRRRPTSGCPWFVTRAQSVTRACRRALLRRRRTLEGIRWRTSSTRGRWRARDVGGVGITRPCRDSSTRSVAVGHRSHLPKPRLALCR